MLETLLAAVVVVACLAGGLTLLDHNIEDQPPAATPDSLWGTWRLAAASVGGVPRDLTTPPMSWPIDWTFASEGSCADAGGACDDGPFAFGSDGCNSFRMPIDPSDPGIVRWDHAEAQGSLIGCGPDPVVDAVATVVSADGFRYEQRGTDLSVVADGVELVFAPLPPPVVTTASG